jgi:hypothetical protein
MLALVGTENKKPPSAHKLGGFLEPVKQNRTYSATALLITPVLQESYEHQPQFQS